MTTFSNNLRNLRSQNGLSQYSVAKKLNISPPAYSKIESGITDVTLSRLAQIADYFGISLVSLLSDGKPVELPNEKEIRGLYDRLRCREDELLILQRRLIGLLEELRVRGAN